MPGQTESDRGHLNGAVPTLLRGRRPHEPQVRSLLIFPHCDPGRASVAYGGAVVEIIETQGTEVDLILTVRGDEWGRVRVGPARAQEAAAVLLDWGNDPA